MESLGFSIYRLTSPANRENFTFVSGLDTFFSLALLGWAFSCSCTVWKGGGERGHPCLAPDLSGKASTCSSLGMMLAVGLSYGFYYVDIVYFSVGFLAMTLYIIFSVCSYIIIGILITIYLDLTFNRFTFYYLYLTFSTSWMKKVTTV